MTTANGAQMERVTLPSLPQPSFVGQGTVVEQTRAIAEVHAAIVVAQQCPRDEDRAVRQMKHACAQQHLAKRAFYSYPRAGEVIQGPSIDLARELARVWGNVQYGIAELRRDDEEGFSEMQAFAWDVETNTRNAHVFIVPHKRNTKNGVKNLTDLRDIYENNANQGARRVREAIFAVLPRWFTEEAQELCHSTISGVSGDELAKRIESIVGAYSRSGITLQQLEDRVGKPRADWTGDEFASLDVLYQSLKRREISKDEAFPPAQPTTDDLIGSQPVPSDELDFGESAAKAAEAARRGAPRSDRIIGKVLDRETGAERTLVAETPAESRAIIEQATLAGDEDPWGDIDVAQPGSGAR